MGWQNVGWLGLWHFPEYLIFLIALSTDTSLYAFMSSNVQKCQQFLFFTSCYHPCICFSPPLLSPRAHLQLHGVEVLRFMSDINQSSLTTPFYSVLVSISTFMSLSTIFHSTTLRFLTLFFRSYLRLLGPFGYIHIYVSL